jgi:hypothetical protein
MDGIWPIVFLAVILKIPVFAGMYLVYYAVKAEPDVEEAPPEEQRDDHHFRRWRREPVPPRGPRRGGHGGGAALPERKGEVAERRDPHRRAPLPATGARR